MPAKLDRCVDDIKAKGDADGVNPYAVCNASINESLPDVAGILEEANKKPFPPINTNTTETHSPLDIIEREAVAIGGGLSGVSIGGKRHEDQKELSIADAGHRSTFSDYEKNKVKEIESICPCDNFDNVHIALMREADNDTEWITVKGAHIPIKKGENKDEVVKSFLAKQGGGEKKAKVTAVSSQSEKELVSSIKAGSKNWKDWGRKESNEKEYAEIERRNQEVPKPKRPEGAGGTIFQDDPKAVSKMEAKVKYLEDVGDYWKKITKFPARDYHTRPTQLGDSKWFEMSNNSTNLRDAKKKLEKIKGREAAGKTLERKPTYKGGKKRFYYEEKDKPTSETIGSDYIFDNVLNALKKETR